MYAILFCLRLQERILNKYFLLGIRINEKDRNTYLKIVIIARCQTQIILAYMNWQKNNELSVSSTNSVLKFCQNKTNNCNANAIYETK